MEERCLKRIEVSFRDDNTPFPGLKGLKDIELWNSKSKIVNDHIRSISKPLKFVTLVNPSHTPVWSIIDKSYNVFTSNEETLSFFQDLINYSTVEDGISNAAMLVKMGESFYLMFFVELLDEIPKVKCLVLEINLQKINSILSMGSRVDSSSPSYFIDEATSKKDEMIDTLLKQRNAQVKSLKMQKQESEKLAKEQQLRIVNIRQNFRRIINKEVKTKMAKSTKNTQIEIADICFRSMQFKFKSLEKVDDKEEKEIKEWLRVFLDVLGA